MAIIREKSRTESAWHLVIPFPRKWALQFSLVRTDVFDTLGYRFEVNWIKDKL